MSFKEKVVAEFNILSRKLPEETVRNLSEDSPCHGEVPTQDLSKVSLEHYRYTDSFCMFHLTITQ
jgi:hypothetical protein